MHSVKLRMRDAWLFAAEMRYWAGIALWYDQDRELAAERLWEAELAERYAFELRLAALRPRAVMERAPWPHSRGERERAPAGRT